MFAHAQPLERAGPKSFKEIPGNADVAKNQQRQRLSVLKWEFERAGEYVRGQVSSGEPAAGRLWRGRGREGSRG